MNEISYSDTKEVLMAQAQNHKLTVEQALMRAKKSVK